LDTSSVFRIASVTMPITSVTIFSLIEKGKLQLNDRVFGSSGVLGPSTVRVRTSNTRHYGGSPVDAYMRRMAK
jgi:D-alanyl-D-alanine carboxypeptidase